MDLGPRGDLEEEEDDEITVKSTVKKYWRFVVAISLLLLLTALPIYGLHVMSNTEQSRVYTAGYTVILMICCWITEVIPLPVTSLLPIFTFPLFGVLASETVTSSYYNEPIVTVVGGILLSLALEFSNLHKRIALRVILWTGTGVKRILLGMMITTSFISLWVANPAVAPMMAPIVTAIVDELERCMKESFKKEYDDALEAAKDEIQEEEDKQGQISGPIFVQSASIGSSDELDGVIKLKTNSPDGTDPKMYLTSSKAIAILSDLEWDKQEKELSCATFLKNMKNMLMVSIAYATNIAGTGCLAGSATNIIGFRTLSEEGLPSAIYGPKAQLTFLNWSAFNLPVMLTNLSFAYLILISWFIWWQYKTTNHEKCCKKKGKPGQIERSIDMAARIQKQFKPTKELTLQVKLRLRQSYNDIGKFSCHEGGVTVIFLLTVLLWIFLDPKAFPGIGSFFKNKKTGRSYTSLATVSTFSTLLLFVVPRGSASYKSFFKLDFSAAKYETLLEWDYVHAKFPWNIFVLLGGGFAMAEGIRSSGLGKLIGCWLSKVGDVSRYGSLAIISYGVTFITEVVSNTSTATVVVPILKNLSIQKCWHPVFLVLPATITSSYAFMLPVATPTNAVVFSACKLRTIDMIIPGLVMNVTSTFILYIYVITLGEAMFSFSQFGTPQRCALLANQTARISC